MSERRRTLLIGGLGSVHDPLLAAALRGCGEIAEALHPRTDSGLTRARALGNHGQCNPAHYAVGAVLEHARRSGLLAKAFCEDRTWVTVGSCGPCRLAAFHHEYSRVLRGEGLGSLPFVFVDPLAFLTGRAVDGFALDAVAASALLAATVAADIVVQVSHALFAYALEPTDVDVVVKRALAELVLALERGGPLDPAMEHLRANGRKIALDPTRVLPRVLLVGEPWTTLADGDPSYDLARRLTVFGAEVAAPTATDWLRYRIWDEAQYGGPKADPLARADTAICATWRRLAAAAALDMPLEKMDELAELARPYYDPRVRGGSAHLEVGRALRATRERSAHLVLSLKPFGCLPSSSLSDGILSVVLRAEGSPRFLALETTGDADATVESRVEMAVHTATLMACDEFDEARARAGISPRDAFRLLEAGRATAFAPKVPGVYACTAAERVRLLASRNRPASQLSS